jgi:hypothetical protein
VSSTFTFGVRKGSLGPKGSPAVKLRGTPSTKGGLFIEVVDCVYRFSAGFGYLVKPARFSLTTGCERLTRARTIPRDQRNRGGHRPPLQGAFNSFTRTKAGVYEDRA